LVNRTTIDLQNRQNLSSPSRILRASAARLACLTHFAPILQIRQAANGLLLRLSGRRRFNMQLDSERMMFGRWLYKSA